MNFIFTWFTFLVVMQEQYTVKWNLRVVLKPSNWQCLQNLTKSFLCLHELCFLMFIKRITGNNKTRCLKNVIELRFYHNWDKVKANCLLYLQTFYPVTAIILLSQTLCYFPAVIKKSNATYLFLHCHITIITNSIFFAQHNEEEQLNFTSMLLFSQTLYYLPTIIKKSNNSYSSSRAEINARLSRILMPVSVCDVSIKELKGRKCYLN